MNYWTETSIEIANQRNYLDQLFKVYPLIPDRVREIDEQVWDAVEESFSNKDSLSLIKNLLNLDLFPIKDSYIPYLRRDCTALERNPETVSRLAGRLYEMGLEDIWEKCSEPKETNRQMGSLFANWLYSGKLDIPIMNYENFVESTENAILKGSDEQLKKFASDEVGYRGEKGLDLLIRFNDKYIIGEAKFLTDFGGHQDRQFEDAVRLVESKDANAIKIAILDGVLYIPTRGSMHRYIKGSNLNIMSSLVLREFIFSID